MIRILGGWLIILSGLLVLARREASPVRWMAYIAGQGYDTNVYQITFPDGRLTQRLTHGVVFRDGLRWSPDGKWIVFSGWNPATDTLDIYRLRGNKVEQLTASPVDEVVPQWSPDGQTILFTQYTDTNLFLHVMQPDGSHNQRLPIRQTITSSGSWSVDGAWVQFQALQSRTGPEIFRWRDGQVEMVTSPEVVERDPVIYGNAVAYFRENGDLMVHRQMIVDVDNGSALQWSPNGAWLAFSGRVAGQDGLFRVRPDGTDLRRIMLLRAGEANVRLQWSPDSAYVVVTVRDRTNQRMRWVDVNGLTETDVLGQPVSYSPTFSPLIDSACHWLRLAALGTALFLLQRKFFGWIP